ncbi:hypothetical protein TWF506_003620 [Arthrobotrys conoides]|uniref:F-box domain-containing protein n=1 Tax=Arthrobotrys conoides TaxID=74498 RepID=A0AAN8NLI6_9PEZI
MTTLESLPVDVKFILLSSLSTTRSLKSLCRASSIYNAVFIEYQSLVESSVYLNEALTRYPREAIWLTKYYQRLQAHEDKSEVPLKAALEYITFPAPAPPVKDFRVSRHDDWRVYNAGASRMKALVKNLHDDFNTPNPHNNIELPTEVERSIIRYHRVIVNICQRLVKYELWRIAPDPPEVLDKYRIKNEPDSYFLVTEAEEGRIIEGLYRFFVGLEISQNAASVVVMSSISELWGIWGVAAVRAAREFLLARIERAGGVNPEREIWYDDSTNYGDGYELEEGSSFFSIPSLVLTYDFPDNIIPWLDGKYDGKHVPRIQEILKITGQNSAGSESWDTTFAFFTQFVPRHNFNGNAARYSRDGKEIWLKSPKTGRIDILASLWDHWRLKKYGYKFSEWGSRDLWDDRVGFTYKSYEYEYYKEDGYWDQLVKADEENVAPEKISRYKNQWKWSKDAKERKAANEGTKNRDAKGKRLRGGSPSNAGQRQMRPVKPEVEEVEEYLQELGDLSV